MNRSSLLSLIKWFWRPRVYFAFAFFVGAAYLLIAFNYTYSDGNRAGYIQKFSKKGWVCKTHEGELALTTVPGVAPVLWNFTVSDDHVATEISRKLGKRVVLHYKERRHLPTTCFGDTPYFVDHVEIQE